MTGIDDWYISHGWGRLFCVFMYRADLVQHDTPWACLRSDPLLLDSDRKVRNCINHEAENNGNIVLQQRMKSHQEGYCVTFKNSLFSIPQLTNLVRFRLWRFNGYRLTVRSRR